MERKVDYSSRGDHPVVLRNMREWLSGTSKDIQTLGELKSVNKNTHTDESLQNLQTIYEKKRCLERLKQFENLKPDKEKNFELNETLYQRILDSSMYSYDRQPIFERWLAYFNIALNQSHIVELNEIFSVTNKIPNNNFTDEEFNNEVETLFDKIVTKFYEAIKHIAEYNTEQHQAQHPEEYQRAFNNQFYNTFNYTDDNIIDNVQKAKIRKYENTMKAAMYMTLLQYTPEDLMMGGGRRKKKSFQKRKKTNKKRSRSKLRKSRKLSVKSTRR